MNLLIEVVMRGQSTSRDVAVRIGIIWIAMVSGAIVKGARPLAAPVSTPHLTAAGACSEPEISADGRYVVFCSVAPNVVPEDDNNASDVFLRDRERGQTILISRKSGSAAAAEGESTAVDMTPDGRFIVFESNATNLISSGLPEVGAGRRNLIYRYDRQTDEMRLINVNRPAVEGHPFATNTLGNLSRDLVSPQISPDGERVLFEIGAGRDPELIETNISEPDPYAVFLWDATSGNTELLSGLYQTNPPETNTASTSYTSSGIEGRHTMTADGRFVALTLNASAPVSGEVQGYGTGMSVIVRDRWETTNGLPGYFVDSQGQLRLPLAKNENLSSVLSLSTNNWLLYELRGVNAGVGFPYVSSIPSYSYDSSPLLWLMNLSSGERFMVSTNATVGEPASAPSGSGAISADGNWVAYFSFATNLVAGDTDDICDVYLLDRTDKVTSRISNHPAWQGTLGSAFESVPVLTPDGRFVLYQAIGSGLFRYDRIAGTNALITTDVGPDLAAISDDGRFVVFTALPASFNSSDFNPSRQVYCYDFETGQTELISVRDPSVQMATPTAPASLELASASADGRFVAYFSRSPNQDSLANGRLQLWLRDTQLGVNTLISRDRNGQPLVTDERFRDVQLSADGRWLCFVSSNDELLYGDTNGLDDVFLFDRQSGYTRFVSFNNQGTGTANGKSFDAILARDGPVIVFKSTATDIAAGGTMNDLYLHDVAELSNSLLTTNTWGTGGASEDCHSATINGNGRFVAFLSGSTNLVANGPSPNNGQPYLIDRVSGAIKFIGGLDPANPAMPVVVEPIQLSYDGSRSLIFGAASMMQNQSWIYETELSYSYPIESGILKTVFSPDGYWVVSSRFDTSSSPHVQLYLRDLKTSHSTLVTRVNNQPLIANGDSLPIGFTRDGRYLLFRSRASNLVANDQNGVSDLYLHDCTSGFNLLISRASSGTANGVTGKALITDDGTRIVFESHATDLVANDRNLERDVFMVQVQAPDSDGDQLPDDWELAYFDNLSKDGTDDSDGDGATDLAEFKAGTNPINSESILRVITLSSVGSGTTTVVWQSMPGRKYQVQYKDSVNDPSWSLLGSLVTAQSESSETVDGQIPSTGQRFYRVLVIE